MPNSPGAFSIPPAPVQSSLELDNAGKITSRAWLQYFLLVIRPVLLMVPDLVAEIAAINDNSLDWSSAIDGAIAAASSDNGRDISGEVQQLIAALAETPLPQDLQSIADLQALYAPSSPIPHLAQRLDAIEAAIAACQTIYGAGSAIAADLEQRIAAIRDFTPHAPTHQDGGGDEVATVTPAAAAIPKAGALGALAIGWIPNTTALGTPGIDTRVPTEKAVRTAITIGNYIAVENGANNAISTPAASGPALIDGLMISVQLAHSLQAGANTLAYLGGTARSIVSHRDAISNIAIAYVSGGAISLIYNATATAWLDLSQ